MTKRILWVSDETPDKDLGGGSIRQYHLIRQMAKYATVDLVVAGELRDDELRNALGRVVELSHPAATGPSVRSWVSAHQPLLPWRIPSDLTGSRRLVELIRQQVGSTDSYDFVQVEHEQLAGLLDRPRQNSWGITFHNLQSVRLHQFANVIASRRGSWLAKRDGNYARRFEQAMAIRYDLPIAVSDEDSAVLGPRAVVIPNGVDLDRFRPTLLPSPPRLLLSASFNWFPNVDGANWFCHHVLPRIRAKIPETTLFLVGRQPDDRIRSLQGLPGVEAHFDVPSVVPYLEACRVAVVPLRIGSGTRLKALEAMAAARPLAGTSIGLEGVGLRDGESAVVADGPEDLAARIVRLCQDTSYATTLAEHARSLATTRFNWDRIATLYVHHVGSLIGLDVPQPAAELPQ